MNYKQLIHWLQNKLASIERVTQDDSDRLAILKGVWMIGKKVDLYVRRTGTSIQDVAEDIGTPKGSLQKYVKFYRQLPKGYKTEIKGKPIGWSHYAAVLYIASARERNFYLKEAALGEWSSHELRRRIRNNYYENRQEHKTAAKQRTAILSSKRQKLYTYSADVLKVVDGDTLLLNIDAGFKIKIEHKVRLRGINCPEVKTKKGAKAKIFVEQELLSIPGCPVVIRTYKAGKFGRYIVDVWYMKGEMNKEKILSKGRHLNQVLLNVKLARKAE